MARIIGGSMIGELSGKLGGNVFARNKAGAYIRQYVVPVDPKSQAQINARNSFGAASSSYHSLTDANKAYWQSFAQNTYLPKTGTNTGQFSGFNAFTSLKNTVINANRLLISAPGYSFGGGAITDPVSNPFVFSIMPPSTRLEANIALSGGGTATMAINDGWAISESGEWSGRLYLNSGISPTSGIVATPFTDGAGNEFGFAVYISNPVQQANMFISNPEQYCLGYVPGIASVTGSIPASEWFDFSGVPIDLSGYQSFPKGGDYVRVTVYSVSTTGQMIRIGSTTLQVEPE